MERMSGLGPVKNDYIDKVKILSQLKSIYIKNTLMSQY